MAYMGTTNKIPGIIIKINKAEKIISLYLTSNLANAYPASEVTIITDTTFRPEYIALFLSQVKTFEATYE